MLTAACTILGPATPARGQSDTGAVATERPEQAVVEKSVTDLMEQLGGQFSSYRSEHFVLISDGGPEGAERLLAQLEGAHDRVIKFCEATGFPPRPTGARLQALFFSNYADFCAHAEKLGYPCTNLTGFYFSQDNRMVLYDVGHDPSLRDLNDEIEQIQKRIERRSQDEASKNEFADLLEQDRKSLRKLQTQRDNQVERLNQLTVQHELAHQVFYNVGVHVIGARNPGWLVEGLACLFEVQGKGERAKLITLNGWRRDDLRAAFQTADGSKPGTMIEQYQKSLDAGLLIPLRQLVGDAQLFSRRDEPHLIHRYAQAWSFVYFLQQRKREELALFMQRVAQREVGNETDASRELADFEFAFGPLDEKFEKQWLGFVQGLLR